MSIPVSNMLRILGIVVAVNLPSIVAGASATDAASAPVHASFSIVGEATPFAPGIASTEFSDVRLTLSRDGRTALWFSRNRPGGAGGYDIWMSHREARDWSAATPVPFNSPARDFDPAFSADGRFVYFCSDRPGGLGGSDVYRVAITAQGFGTPEHLGAAVNSAGDEYAPMLSPDGTRLLFSSDRPGGAGRHDLYVARLAAGGFERARPLPGDINTAGDEFDATYLADGSTVVFARAPDLRKDRVDLHVAAWHGAGYEAGTRLPQTANSGEQDTYGAMLDWSRPDRITISGHRAGSRDVDLYLVRYTLQAEAGTHAARAK
jgi:Tol biopolymer transport system component